jgi:hypothetical protein
MLAECREMGEIEASFDLKPILRLEFVRRAFEDLQAREELREHMLAAREMYDKRERAEAA